MREKEEGKRKWKNKGSGKKGKRKRGRGGEEAAKGKGKTKEEKRKREKQRRKDAGKKWCSDAKTQKYSVLPAYSALGAGLVSGAYPACVSYLIGEDAAPPRGGCADTVERIDRLGAVHSFGGP